MNDNDESASEAVNIQSPKTRKKQIRSRIAVFGVVLVLTGVIVAGVLTGRLAVAFGRYSTVVVNPGICTADDVTAFNHRYDTDDSGFGAVAEDILSRSGQKNDVNCAFMLHMYFYGTRQYSKAVDNGERVIELINTGHFIDNRIESVQSLEAINQRVMDIKSLQDGKAQDDGFDE